ncbi:hypothetical protein Q3G72_018234 [Acer saccharum]|nr:hypothetical protein Q3G72_018234 [Acer saccharum]
MAKLKVAGTWSGDLQVELEQWTVPMLREEVAKQSSMLPETINLICAGKVLKDGNGSEKLSQLGIKNNAKILATRVSADEGKSLVAEEERSRRLTRVKAAAAALVERHADGSLPLEDFNIELEDQNRETIRFGTETDRRAMMMGLMLHANAKKLIRRQLYTDALEVLTMGELVDNVPLLQIDMVWCYFMLRDISWLSVAGMHLQKAREGIERANGKDSFRMRLLQAGRHPELALHLRMELLEGVVAYHSDLYNWKNLKHLSMDETNLNISILQRIGWLTSLEFLSLQYCNLEGTFPDQGGLYELKHLQELHLKNNDLRGSLPWCFGNLTSRQVLDLYSNQFSGNISTLRALTSIQYLSLSDNHFQIPISLEPFFNHSKLKYFDGDNNQIYADTESHFSITPKFQLNPLVLSGCRDCVTFPKFLYHQHDLNYVDLSHNNLTGEFPNWLLDNNTNLQLLVLVNNSLTGPLHLPTHSHQHLTSLDISNNFFHRNIPIQVGAYLPRLLTLNISNNDFDGHIPSSIGDMNSLETFDLSNNKLSS